MAANAYIIDAMTKHMVYLQRLAAGNANRLDPFLTSLASDLKIAVSNTPSLQTETFQNLMNLTREVQALTDSLNDQYSSHIMQELKDTANYEAQFVESLLGGVVNVQLSGISPAVLDAIFATTQMALAGNKEIQYLTMQQAVDHFAGAVKDDVMQTIRSGSVLGRTTPQIARDVHNLVDTRSRRQSEALVRTMTNHVATVARSEFYQANQDVIAKEKWVSTLDQRTTIFCIVHDQAVYDVGEGPSCPAHWNCRSVRVPVIDPKYQLPGFEGQRPEKGSDGVGVVGANTTYSGWLRRQSSDFQDEVLGPERAKLFRGGMSVDKFVDRSGITYTLKELKAKEGL